jgi:glycosyltransferase involved in cell wall biosynthesis
MTPPKVVSILTNHGGQEASPTWRFATTYVYPEDHDLISSLQLALTLYRKRLDFDCVVLGGGRSDHIFTLLQSILPFRKAPCVMVDCYWTKSLRKWKYALHKTCLKLGSKTVDRYIVWAKHETKGFSETFEIPIEKFLFVPYHTTVEMVHAEVTQGNYIFSGGNVGRDYKTLIEAVRSLPVKVLIASTRTDLFADLSIPPNVEVKGFSHEEYIRRMAGCLINVVSLDDTLLRSPGQQTFLNSMWLGKPTIVNDPKGAADYINHGEDGLIVQPRDPMGLRAAIQLLLDSPDAMKEMGRKASEKAKTYSTEEHFKRIVSVVFQVVEGRRRSSSQPK